MNVEEAENHRQNHWVRLCASIKAEAHRHKICLICSSASYKTTTVCPVCHGYQWDEREETVIATVDMAATSVFPFTLGYAPSSTRDGQSDTLTMLTTHPGTDRWGEPAPMTINETTTP